MKPASRTFLLLVLLVLLTLAGSVHPALSQSVDDVFEMEISQLMQMDVVVTSVSKRPQKIHETASAVYVVTQEDVRRSGAVNIMEALRMVPGVLVSKVNQNKYVISIRGFNRLIGSNKLLVLIDGRSIYSPLFSGVLWIGQDVVLEDIDRIEVIRGPGAALWGSNAVAGVINIITKSASETQGVLAAAGAGTERKSFRHSSLWGKGRRGFLLPGLRKVSGQTGRQVCRWYGFLRQ